MTDSEVPLADDAFDQVMRLQDELQTFLNPIPRFRGLLPAIRTHIPECCQRRIRVTRLPGMPIANARSSARRLKCLGYVVQIHPDLYYLLNDAVEFIIAATTTVDNSFKELVPAVMSRHETVSGLRQSILHYLESHGGWSPSLTLVAARRERKRRELFLPIERRLEETAVGFLNSMMLFILAHEVGHIIAGHCDRDRPENIDDRWIEELEADTVGTLALFRWLNSTVVSLAIPERQAAIMAVGAICGLTIAFGLYGIIETAAHATQRKWDESYPPAVERYKVLRETLTTKFAIDSLAFSAPICGLGPPDAILEAMVQIGASINWSNNAQPIRL